MLIVGVFVGVLYAAAVTLSDPASDLLSHSQEIGTTIREKFRFMDRPLALAGRGQAHRLVLDQLGRGEAVVRLDERQVEQVEPSFRERLLPGECRTLELDDVALAHRQEVVDVL
jgi:hypothetical protein